jgi:hypothetical protein
VRFTVPAHPGGGLGAALLGLGIDLGSRSLLVRLDHREQHLGRGSGRHERAKGF